MNQIQAADAALVVCMWRPISLVFNWIIWIPRCTSDTWADRRCARHLVEATCRCGPYTCCRGNRSKQSRRIRRPQRASDSNMCRRLVIKNIIYLSRVGAEPEMLPEAWVLMMAAPWLCADWPVGVATAVLRMSPPSQCSLTGLKGT